MTTMHQQATNMAQRVIEDTQATEAGVVVSVRLCATGLEFDIWAMGPDGRINSESLALECTCEERLRAHVAGFIENHLAAHAAAAH